MRRAYVISLIVGGVLVFLVISALLARALSVGGAEQSAITQLIKAEARGDVAGVEASVDGCRASSACRTRATSVATALKHPGTVSILSLSPSSGFSLGPTLGTARVAWTAGSSLPRVQCVRVRHAGSILAGFRIELLEVSVAIESDSVCPNRF